MQRDFYHGLLGALLGLAGQHAALAQDNQQIMPNYRDADIRQVIEAVGAVTGRNFLVDPRVRADVTLLSFSPMTPDTFYQAFLSTLQVHGYAAIEAEGVVQIIPDATSRQFGGAGPEGAGADVVTRVIELANVGATPIVPILRPLIPQAGNIVAHAESNILIISDRSANVDRLVNIIRRIDVSGAADIEVIPLENASATETVRMLGALTQTAQAAGGAATIQAIADERTNSVLLSGTEPNRLRYRALIAHLDTPSESGGDTQVRYLRYADAEELAPNLQNQFRASGTAGEEAGPDSGDISIWADAGTNALVLNAPVNILQDINAVIDKIDIRRAQVQVDAIIVEVSEEIAAELGVTWAIDGSAADSGVGLTNFNIGTGIVQVGAAAASGALNPAALAQGVTIGLGSFVDAGTSWAAIISALRGDAATNVVSTPTIVTLDNEEAEINVGQEVPFLTGSFANTGAAQGAINPFQTIQRQDVGTRLAITPQINEGSGVRLTIEQETSSVAAGTAGAVDLVTNTRSITTSVFVEDGQMLVLGGLIDDQLRQQEQRVPGLGRIPGLRWLFRARNAERVRTNLMVFIRPTILRDSEEARFETNAKYQYLRDLQLEDAEEPIPLLRDETRPTLPEIAEPAQSAEAPGEDENQADGNGP
ncbi:type II secretion system secretin GspD [Candidatus Rariloculus sp.]|uniref:type II secretion system secretin GspD n=1 Tax=Candidatus Rariloculus sp. TaxID=3101265 RepID=UPI003D0CBF73